MPEIELVKKVEEYWINSNWDWCTLSNYLHQNQINLIRATMVYSKDDNPDSITWVPEAIGTFTTASAYDLDGQRAPVMKQGMACERLWKLKGPGRWQFLLWIVKHGRLLTNTEKHRRHLHPTGQCEICWAKSETIPHALRDCEWMSVIWSKLVQQKYWRIFKAKTLDQWVDWNIKEGGIGRN